MAQYRHYQGNPHAQARIEAAKHQSHWTRALLAAGFLLAVFAFAPSAKAAMAPMTRDVDRVKQSLVDSGHFGELFQVAMGAYNDGNIATAMRLWESLAESGYAAAQYNLGVAHARGITGKSDIDQAYRWWTAAAEQGNSDAQYNLGLLFATGNGVERDMHKAVYWWQQAARVGDAAAQYNLGMMFARGDGVARNMEAAVHWWMLSAAQEFPQAKQILNELTAH